MAYSLSGIIVTMKNISLNSILIFLIISVVAFSGGLFIYRHFNAQETIIGVEAIGSALLGNALPYGQNQMAATGDATSSQALRLENSPEIIKAVYLTSWSAATKKHIDYIIDLAHQIEINAVVIDIKDYSGVVPYDTKIKAVEAAGAERIRIADINALLKQLHENGLYAIARIVVFQDPILALKWPDLAVKSAEKIEPNQGQDIIQTIWLDDNNLAWLDPSSEEVWYYNLAIAREAWDLGFDEINFDYVRFPTDGNLSDMVFPFWDGKTPKREVIKGFFTQARQELFGAKLSIDLFGIAAVSQGEFGVGQVLEDALPYFDYVCLMVYPSHFDDGFDGFSNPAEHPYEVVFNSLTRAQERLIAFQQQSPFSIAKLRPWLQDFDLGATYTPEMVRSEIRAVSDALGDEFNGFMLWSADNYYSQEALQGDLK